jgi:hypothetical protein
VVAATGTLSGFNPTIRPSIITAINIWLNAGRHIPGIIYCCSSLQGPHILSFFFLSQLQVNGKIFPTKKA